MTMMLSLPQNRRLFMVGLSDFLELCPQDAQILIFEGMCHHKYDVTQCMGIPARNFIARLIKKKTQAKGGETTRLNVNESLVSDGEIKRELSGKKPLSINLKDPQIIEKNPILHSIPNEMSPDRNTPRNEPKHFEIKNEQGEVKTKLKSFNPNPIQPLSALKDRNMEGNAQNVLLSSDRTQPGPYQNALSKPEPTSAGSLPDNSPIATLGTLNEGQKPQIAKFIKPARQQEGKAAGSNNPSLPTSLAPEETSHIRIQSRAFGAGPPLQPLHSNRGQENKENQDKEKDKDQGPGGEITSTPSSRPPEPVPVPPPAPSLSLSVPLYSMMCPERISPVLAILDREKTDKRRVPRKYAGY